jgi:alpha-tubulin suppressor-like RCC1 family protein
MVLALVGSALSVIVTATPAEAITMVSQVNIGYDHACAITPSGTAYCWGGNSHGQLGNGTTTDSNTPVAVNGGYTWAQISAGNYTTCGVTTAGTAYCWGYGTLGQIGNGVNSDKNTPTLVSGGYTWASISSGMTHVCGVTTAGVAYCWGSNVNGALGDGNNTQVNTPHLVSGGYTWASVQAGGKFSCGVTTTGVGYCWGYNNTYQLGDGDGTTNNTNTPVAVSGGYTWASISPSLTATYSCGVTTAGVGYCWGQGNNGDLGTGSNTTQQTPTVVTGSHTWVSISTGSGVTCGVTTGNAGYCWGAGTLGAVGNGTFTTSNSNPVAISGSYSFTQLDGGGGGACGITSVQMVYCWGWDQYGTLGDGMNTNEDVPTYVVSLSGDTNNTTASITIDPAFTFTVANQASACNGESNFVSGAGTASTVALGHLAAGSNVSGGQALSVSSNAGSGFTVYIRGTQASQNLRNAGHNWTDVTGSYASPAVLGAGERFGYTYKDSTASSSVTNPTSANFVALTNATTNAIMGSTTSETGSGCVSYDAQTSGSTPAGSYTATVIYTAVPTY